MRIGALLLLAIGACCAHRAAPAPITTEDHVTTSGTIVPRAYVLIAPEEEPLGSIRRYPGPPPEPVSPEFAASYAIFLEGRRAYRDQQYPRAAELFLRAARTLTVRSGAYAATAGGNRSALYEDAAYAWILAGTADAGRATLAQLERDRVATHDELARARAALDR